MNQEEQIIGYTNTSSRVSMSSKASDIVERNRADKVDAILQDIDAVIENIGAKLCFISNDINNIVGESGMDESNSPLVNRLLYLKNRLGDIHNKIDL